MIAESKRIDVSLQQDWRFVLLASGGPGKVVWRQKHLPGQSVAHSSCQGLCWRAPVKTLHLGQQLQLQSPPDCIYSNPQSFSEIHLPSTQAKQVSCFLSICFLAVPCGMQDLSSLTRDQTHAPSIGSTVSATGPLGKSPNRPAEQRWDHYPSFFWAINGGTNLCSSSRGGRIAFGFPSWETWGILGASTGSFYNNDPDSMGQKTSVGFCQLPHTSVPIIQPRPRKHRASPQTHQAPPEWNLGSDSIDHPATEPLWWHTSQSREIQNALPSMKMTGGCLKI